MFIRDIKHKFFLIVVKLPVVSILVITITLASILIIAYSSYTNIYIKQSAEIDYTKENEKTFIQLYIDKKDIGQATINSDVLWYLEQEGKWYKAPITEIKDITENLFYLRIEPVQEDIIEEFANKPAGVYPVNVEVLTGRERVVEKLFGDRSEGA